MSLHPILVFLNFHRLVLTGKVHYPRFDQINLLYPQNSEPGDDLFAPFLVVTCDHPDKPSNAALRVTFRVKGLEWFHRYFLPYAGIPLFTGAPGFHAKAFYYRSSDTSYRGQYLWESREAAETYINSYPGQFMRKLAIPGSLEINVLDNESFA
ncbi:hypothetical protein hrd7_14690 [Leptolinea sp. HRD-7]|jgi:hypothetical protein|nr:hypothetical protein hrd7_14690 [Leptolinea sp. HRD-7]